MRVPIFVLFLILALAAGCANAEWRDGPTEQDGQRPAREDLSSSARTFPSDSPTDVVGFGGGSLWVIDWGDYQCDDVPGIEASCHGPEKVFLRRLDQDTREVEATIPLRGDDGAGVAFGAGSAWVAYENYDSPLKSGVLRLDLRKNGISHRVPLKRPTSIAFGEGFVWVTNLTGGMMRGVDEAKNALDGPASADGTITRVIVRGGERLREVNNIPPRMLVKAGSTLLVPRASLVVELVSHRLGAVRGGLGLSLLRDLGRRDNLLRDRLRSGRRLRRAGSRRCSVVARPGSTARRRTWPTSTPTPSNGTSTSSPR